MFYYIVYKTTCLVNNYIYVGVHKTKDPNIFDGYLGRGFWKHSKYYLKSPKGLLHRAIIKYGIENFKRETIKVFPGTEKGQVDAYKLEETIVNQEFINRKDTYNVALGGKIQSPISRRIYQFDFKGNLIEEYASAEKAANIVGVNVSNIHDAALHKRTSSNSLWAYETTINLQDYQITNRNKYYLYDSSGYFIKEFNTSSECIDYLNTNTGNLSRAIKLNNKISGYFVSTEKYDKLQVTITPLSGKLNRYDSNGKYLDSFNSIAEAKQKLGLKLCSISQAIKLKRKCNGYYWTRTNNPEQVINI